jgi:hypothetical protein
VHLPCALIGGCDCRSAPRPIEVPEDTPVKQSSRPGSAKSNHASTAPSSSKTVRSDTSAASTREDRVCNKSRTRADNGFSKDEENEQSNTNKEGGDMHVAAKHQGYGKEERKTPRKAGRPPLSDSSTVNEMGQYEGRGRASRPKRIEGYAAKLALSPVTKLEVSLPNKI